jgi:putative metalloprotease
MINQRMIHMKNTKLLLAIATSAALLTGCQNTHGIDTNMAISSGLNAYKAATLSDADAKAIANQGCAEMDSGNQVASKSSSTVNVWQKSPKHWVKY